MKGSNPRITLLGNNSGRNLGDATILSAILHSISRLLPSAEFYVPSISPQFIDQHYGGRFKVKGVDVSPRTLSMRLLGLSTFSCLAKSDIALICDGIIFGHKLFSPHNFLITLIFVVPLARLFRCKVICFSCGIGPFPTKLSALFARWVINLCDLVIMRDNDSKKLAEEIGVTRPIQVTGDAAFLNYVSSDARAEEIARAHGLDPRRPLLGLNITPYLDAWLTKAERLAERDRFVDIIVAGALDAMARIAAERSDDVPQLVLFSCSPMDEKLTEELAVRLKAPVIDNTRYLSHDIQAVMKRCGLLVGMRFHSLILSSSVGVPVIGLIYAPKVRGYLRLLGFEELGIELNKLTPELLADKVTRAWLDREEIRRRQQLVVSDLREGAQRAAEEVAGRYFPTALQRGEAESRAAAVGAAVTMRSNG